MHSQEILKRMYEFLKAEALKLMYEQEKKGHRPKEHKSFYPFTVSQRASESHGFDDLREGTNLLFNRLREIAGSRKLLNQRERNQN